MATDNKMVKIFRTNDGSHSLKDQRTNETYHSDRGAVQESMHVYINAGLLTACTGKQSINLLEMGFGTGLNALLSYLHAPVGINLHYVSIEAFPLEHSLLKNLEYDNYLQTDKKTTELVQLSPFGETQLISSSFSLTKYHTDFTTFQSNQVFDLIYYDAFGPRIQPELWTQDCMEKCYGLLKPGGILVTYCSQGQFRRNLVAAGFRVEKLAGPPGKREITRATKP